MKTTIMKPDEINIAIAEFCGIVSQDSHGKLYHTRDGYVRNCPDYYGDLNACRDAIEKLNYIQLRSFAQQLAYSVLDQENGMGYYEVIGRIAKLQAPVLCRYLLRTIGKWRDGQ